MAANEKRDWSNDDGESTIEYLKKSGFSIKRKDYKASDIVYFFIHAFNNIWRCADSGSWHILKDNNLLTFNWLDKSIDYSKKANFSTIKRGLRSIDPWVNELYVGDLIFVMGKNTFDGICVAESEYNFVGPFLNLTGEGEKPAIQVKYLIKLNEPITHSLKTHNNPSTFANIKNYNFGLKNVIEFLLQTMPQAIYNVMNYINDRENKDLSSETYFQHSLNTILYGPPGTGKTFKLNEYKDEYFTDKGIKQEADEALKDRVSEYPLWQVVAAVLQKATETISVTELLNDPLIKAKLNPLAKAPRQAIWRVLQSYANDSSTELETKYRGSIQLFEKDQKSKWSIIEGKRAELQDIVGQELMDLAANPVLPPVASTSLKKRYNFITFHQKYSYEDFIEGIKPLLKEDNVVEQVGELQFELKKGIFYDSCLEALRLAGYESFKECYNDSDDNRRAKFEDAKKNSSMQFALFIDEINRANISAVFGELITLIEDDKRMGAANEMWIKLPYSKEMFCVPANLYIIGTMNTADRSIALLDIALRRRFEFKALYPEYTESAWWAPLLEKLNLAIYNWKKNPDFFIGHAFFMNKLESDSAKILNTKIIPLLYEYCQNNADTIKKILDGAGIKINQGGIKENFQFIAE